MMQNLLPTVPMVVPLIDGMVTRNIARRHVGQTFLPIDQEFVGVFVRDRCRLEQKLKYAHRFPAPCESGPGLYIAISPSPSIICSAPCGLNWVADVALFVSEADMEVLMLGGITD
jgi:hypothetical protein